MRAPSGTCVRPALVVADWVSLIPSSAARRLEGPDQNQLATERLLEACGALTTNRAA